MTKRALTWGLGLLLSGFAVSVTASTDANALHLPVWQVARSSSASSPIKAGFLSARGEFAALFDEEAGGSKLPNGYWIEIRKWEVLIQSFPQAQSAFLLEAERGEIRGIKVGRITLRERRLPPHGLRNNFEG